MPLVKTRGAASAQGFGEFAQATAANYIEDVFSTWLYTGNGSTQTITNNIDLSTKGGLVWTKSRTYGNNGGTPGDHVLWDSSVQSALNSNTTYSASGGNQNATTGGVFAFYNNGFLTNQGFSGANFATWTFRKQTKFFDVVTYTGNGVAGRTVAHNLGSVPGCMIVKCTSTATTWSVYHTSLGATQRLQLDGTGAAVTSSIYWNNTSPTSTQFSVGTNGSVNNSGDTYVAYLFAHDAGGFGLTGTDNVISCGSYVGNGLTAGPQVTLGYEPQWVLRKNATAARGGPGTAGSWSLVDNMRGMSQTTCPFLFANESAAEDTSTVTTGYIIPNATGFVDTYTYPGDTYIYIAIRRGPMKVPTDATKVFAPVAYSGNRTARTITTNFVTDLVITRCTTELFNGSGSNFINRLVGRTKFLEASSTSSEITDNYTITGLDNNTGYFLGTDSNSWGFNRTGENYVSWSLERAPSFFDVVCFTGNNTYGYKNHNLTVVPELIISKRRDTAQDWLVWQPSSTYVGYLNLTNAFFNNGPSPATATQFTPILDQGGATYVVYLFASAPGVSKVGTYTGNGTTQTINCGFTGGARFVLIKRTDTSGGWYTYDTARGMTVLTDPYSLMNDTAAETATLGSVTTVSTGFALNSAILAAINVNAGTYIFLAIA